ncbi:hypothetical protein CY34DRAFT_116697 [Suillus luteus UH-Slu-Lm8-n1]|uniref:Unplaced genomic scaffold CY34scaffold_1, whole genome shotgun sequence n=1 Tax=Suillus luteus UH-Slu-Lm8-n1 TaxID=930992 RepID=A0A0D0B690_9AGAM|nr:hypothetical protein CY34DRAFT_116697 [Suillus luteus UH-Slu-Lm8-n1]
MSCFIDSDNICAHDYASCLSPVRCQRLASLLGTVCITRGKHMSRYYSILFDSRSSTSVCSDFHACLQEDNRDDSKSS